MSTLDYSIVGIYLILMVIIGLYFQRKASSSIESFFLSDRKMSWWMLGASGMASNLDVSGTMINVALIYAFGISGFFIEIRGGIVLIMAFLMIFMGKWNRRARVMTMAEWMKLRFGDGIQGKTARLITAISTLIFTIWIVTYFAFGTGKFTNEFLNLSDFGGMSGEFWAAAIMITLAMLYTVASGLYGVVWTDIFQGFFIFFSIIAVCYISYNKAILPDVFSVSIPLNKGGFYTIETTKTQWTNILPSWNLNFPENSTYSIYNLFGITILFYLLKVVIEGCSGIGGYMIQRFYASRSDKDAGLLSLFWTFLLAFRWPFIAAIAIMGISYGTINNEIIADPEKVLPKVLNYYIPIGLKGLLVAGLISAAMSTFDSLVNAGAAYWVKDIYQAFINKSASERQLLFQSRFSSVIIVLLGLFFTLDVKSINEIWGWLTMSLGAGIGIPLLVRWYWWRLNGYGFAAGTAMGVLAAIGQKLFFLGIPEYVAFLFIGLISLAGIILGALITRPTNIDVLSNFYKKTRPFGFWNPVKKLLSPNTITQISKENLRDRIAASIAVPWQITLFLTLMVVMIKRWDFFFILFAALIIFSIGLYFFWFKHLNIEVHSDD